MSSPDDIARVLFSRTTKGIRLGLDRMLRAAGEIGDPQNAYRSIHVAGTNGKGSTCAFVESCLRAGGVKTGLFTSPHILRFEERFIIDGTPVEGRKWLEVYRDLEGVIGKNGLTFFEAATLIAFELFKREKVGWAVLETGMGGRLDATNIVTPRASVITALAMDHMNFLGGTLSAIAAEKLGIVKKNVPLVMRRPPQKKIRELALRRCDGLGAPCVFVSETDARDCSMGSGGASFTYKNTAVEIALPGSFQIQNALAALSALECSGAGELSLLSKGMAPAFVPGRFQTLSIGGRTVVFDVGHNPGAADELVKCLTRRFGRGPLCIVAGIMKDKDFSGMLRRYCTLAAHLILTRPNIERAAGAAVLHAAVPASFKGTHETIPEVKDAVGAALKKNASVICITGSFYTVGEAMTVLGVEPWARRRS